MDFGYSDRCFYPAGFPDSIQGLGPGDGCEFLLFFDEGMFSEDNTFLISARVAQTLPEILTKNSKTNAVHTTILVGHRCHRRAIALDRRQRDEDETILVFFRAPFLPQTSDGRTDLREYIDNRETTSIRALSLSCRQMSFLSFLSTFLDPQFSCSGKLTPATTLSIYSHIHDP